jgi:hypothetical protein
VRVGAPWDPLAGRGRPAVKPAWQSIMIIMDLRGIASRSRLRGEERRAEKPSHGKDPLCLWEK